MISWCEHLRKQQTKSVLVFPREAFDFQGWDAISFSIRYVYSKMVNPFDKNSFLC